jgi:hypothetical protein
LFSHAILDLHPPNSYLQQDPTSMRVGFLVFLLGITSNIVAQTRYYVMFGSNFTTTYYTDGFYVTGLGNRIYTTANDYKTKQIGKYITADFVVEKRINNTIYGVTGLSLLRAGYKDKSTTNFSELDCTYLAVPLMMRMNFVQAIMLDVGPVFRFPLKADLKETALKGSLFERSDDGSVLPYLTKVSFGATMQLSIIINRYILTGYLVYGKHAVDKDIEEDWGLSGSYRYNSLFLRDIQPRFTYTLSGFKIGMRL